MHRLPISMLAWPGVDLDRHSDRHLAQTPTPLEPQERPNRSQAMLDIVVENWQRGTTCQLWSGLPALPWVGSHVVGEDNRSDAGMRVEKLVMFFERKPISHACDIIADDPGHAFCGDACREAWR